MKWKDPGSDSVPSVIRSHPRTRVDGSRQQACVSQATGHSPGCVRVHPVWYPRCVQIGSRRSLMA